MVIACVCALLIGSGVAYGVFKLTSPNPSPSKSGEVLLQPGADTGPDPFTSSVASTRPAVAGTPSPAAGQTGGDVKVASTRGSTPGLYGGTQQAGTCNPDQLVAYLRENQSKAAAWVQVLNSDPGLRWSGGTQVRVDQIEQYVHEMTSVLVRTDTRITNHGYRSGAPTTFASVLEAGSAVLVDGYGVPRARCACGNPLTSATSVSGSPVFVGQRWKTFNSTRLVVIAPSTTVINNFVVVNVNTGAPFARPAGGTGASDAAADPAAVAQLAPGAAPGSGGPPVPGLAPGSTPGSNQPQPGVAQVTPTPSTSPNQRTAPGIAGQAPTPEPTSPPPAVKPAVPQAPSTSPPTPPGRAPAAPATPPATERPTPTPTPTPTPSPSASPTPDVTPFVGTWTGQDGSSLIVKPSGTVTYKATAAASPWDIELTDATATTLKGKYTTGPKAGEPFTATLQGGKLVVDGTSLTR